ncbi:hypothetical protein AK812_SmicGene45544 [Symbiodinium microadriaticum]|uniref:Uncharacterized protein n=1 Tax=Symbiodinium microadriaticum TaxID=2951 RepID=A0A1Q9BVV5_SYMMI|nr:hypothetical protein AK812_SmicGene45544 [Symbiodinium microadriaticum]CAE7555383.1 unnamed protein product [Symbiodinium microadriaticum]
MQVVDLGHAAAHDEPRVSDEESEYDVRTDVDTFASLMDFTLPYKMCCYHMNASRQLLPLAEMKCGFVQVIAYPHFPEKVLWGGMNDDGEDGAKPDSSHRQKRRRQDAPSRGPDHNRDDLFGDDKDHLSTCDPGPGRSRGTRATFRHMGQETVAAQPETSLDLDEAWWEEEGNDPETDLSYEPSLDGSDDAEHAGLDEEAVAALLAEISADRAGSEPDGSPAVEASAADRGSQGKQSRSSSDSSSSSGSSSSDSSSSSDGLPGPVPSDPSDDESEDLAGVMRRPGTMEIPFRAPGLGELRFNNDGFLRAHCQKHGRDCKRQRATHPNPRRAGQGRPVGLLMCWLEAQHSVSSAEEHKRLQVGSYEERRAARQRFNEIPGGLDFARSYEAAGEDEIYMLLLRRDSFSATDLGHITSTLKDYMTKLREEPPLDWADILLSSADPDVQAMRPAAAQRRQDMGKAKGLANFSLIAR